MHNLSVEFTYPWLLLLLIPAAALTIFLYLRLNKKYRRNRNRITSVVLHSIVMLLCILTLSGFTFHYQVGNDENELILLVDMSDTTEENKESREEFVRSAIMEGSYEGCRIGVVTFGFTQENALPLSYNVENAFNIFLDEVAPSDTTATDIAAALRFAASLFEHPDTGKIVLISDGKETDESAISAARSIAAQGVLIDTVYFPSNYPGDLIQIKEIDLPDYNVKAGENCQIDVIIEGREFVSGVTVELYDNGVLSDDGTSTGSGSQLVDINGELQTVHFDHVFQEQGLHELHARVQYGQDALSQNNEFYAYRWLQIYNKILILEQQDQSQRLTQLLEEDEVGYEITRGNVKTGENIPQTIDDLRKYDQVILNNISSHDLEGVLVTNPNPEAKEKQCGLDDLLYEYVYTYGGGLFTSGGMEEDGLTAHAYNREDMNGTRYQQMLPVQVIDYTPPVGVFIVIDISGSMVSAADNGRTRLEWAKQGAIECLSALSDRDYIGIMTMDTDYGMVLDLTPKTQENYIKEKILGIGSGEATYYSTAIDRCAQRLAHLDNVDKKHIVLVTDGLPAQGDTENYLKSAKDAYENQGITLSVIGIEIQEGGDAYKAMELLVSDEYGHGRLHITKGSNLMAEMREELNAPEIESVKYSDFQPQISSSSVLSPLLNGVERGDELNNRHMIQAQLGGFFGVKARANDDVEVVLVGDYNVPIYAQWPFGKGMVGSFMCDLYGDWSAEFMENSNGKRFLQNVFTNLMPKEDIRPASVRLELEEENYINSLRVFHSLDLSQGQYLVGQITLQTEEGEESYSLNSVSEVQGGDVYVTVPLSFENGAYSMAEFIIKKGGIYTISVTVCDADGNELETVSIYKAFAYSSEFDFSVDEENLPEDLMKNIATLGKGEVIPMDSPWEIYSTFVTELERTFDPRWLFMITAMVLFLLDIAVRKFKFKWPHELIRDYKNKKAGKL